MSVSPLATPQRGPQEDVFLATVASVRPVAAMLRSLAFRSKAVVDVTAEGLTFIVEEGRSVQAKAYLSSDASFASYTFNPPFPSDSDLARPTPDDGDDEDDHLLASRVVFGISLATLLECLNIFGNAGPAGGAPSGWDTNGGGKGRDAGEGAANNWKKRGAEEVDRIESGKSTSMRMSYAGEGSDLVLLLEEGGIVTRCEITTYEPDQLMELPFDDDSKVQKLIMKSEWLRDAFAEIDPSSEKLTITFSPAEHAPTPYNRWTGNRNSGDDEEENEGTPTFRLESIGGLGSTEMDFPNDKDVLELFECGSLVRNSYKFSHVQLTNKALAASSKVSIRTSEDGIINFQFMVPLGRARDGKSGFVEFVCIPLDED